MKFITHRKGLQQLAVPSPTIPPATTTNAWILNSHTIVDPAATQKITRTKLLELVQHLPLKQIFLTHHHQDHIGSAAFLRENLNIPIACSSICAAQVSFSVDIIIHDSQILDLNGDIWEALETPGHAKGHLCLYSSQHHDIVAGDMVAGEGTILLVPGDGDFGDYISQLTRLKSLAPQSLYPAHGPPITEAQDYLQHYIDHRQARLSQIFDALQKVPLSPKEIAKNVYHDLNPIFIPIAAKQVECHLLYLEQIKQAQSSSEGWTRI